MTIPRMPRVSGILFDKDGTLFDFHASWGEWAARQLDELACGDRALVERMARALDFDPDARRFGRGSPVIAGTPETVVETLAPHVPEHPREALHARLVAGASEARMVPAVPLAPLLARLRRHGLRLGVATNDAEAPARAHLEAAGAREYFDFVAGFDSGHGAKPAPGVLLAFARAAGLAPGAVLMVGDSRHDMLAGRAAGMRTAGVLTGPATRDDLAPVADVVLRDIGELPALLGRLSAPDANDA